MFAAAYWGPGHFGEPYWPPVGADVQERPRRGGGGYRGAYRYAGRLYTPDWANRDDIRRALRKAWHRGLDEEQTREAVAAAIAEQTLPDEADAASKSNVGVPVISADLVRRIIREYEEFGEEMRRREDEEAIAILLLTM